MNRFVEILYTVAGISLIAGPVLAGPPRGPAPILASGPAGIAVLAVAGVGYVVVRALRRRP